MKHLRPEPQPQTFQAQDTEVEVVVLEDTLGMASIRLHRRAPALPEEAFAAAQHSVAPEN